MSSEKTNGGRRWILAATTGVVAALALTTAGFAWAGQHGMGPMAGGLHGHFGERFARLHVEMMTEHALREAKATPEQREKIQAILDKAFADHQAFRKQHESLRREGLEVLSADTVDRARIEDLRVRHLQIAEEGSKHLASVLADVADVLTPAQRQKLAAHVHAVLE
jgi:protein CpxP